MRQVKGSGEREKKTPYFFLPSPSPLSFFHLHTYRKGYYFQSSQSSTCIKSTATAATTILRARTRFRSPKIRLHCRLILKLTVGLWEHQFTLFYKHTIYLTSTGLCSHQLNTHLIFTFRQLRQWKTAGTLVLPS